MRYLLHDVFDETVKLFPCKIAITQEDGGSFTYSELNDLSNRFANCFKSYKEDIIKTPYIGILSSVHAHSIAAILGALKIGCAYVPLDEHSPTERLLKIVNNIKLDLLVIDPVLMHQHEELCSHPSLKKVILLNFTEMEHEANEPPTINQVSDDLAYILHSSGSTGVPKGIMLTHRNARTFVDWMHKEFSMKKEDIVMSRAPFKFDLSVFDIFNTFKCGGRLVCYNWNRKREGDQKHKDYVALMEREGASVLYTTPSTFITLLNRGDLEKAKLKLTRIMYAGEPFAVPQLRRLKNTLSNVRIANIYGPTETNIITYYWIDKLPDEMDAIPLGAVVEDTEIIVVSENGQRICERDEVGELWCRGGTVTLGYVGMPEATERHLVNSPFHPYPCQFWRTGDFGFLDKNGLLHYRGRQDHMVKVKGYRIEIGEVEAALAHCSGIDEFAAVAIPQVDYGHELIIYYSKLPSNELNSENILDLLKTKLPKYMLPSHIIEMPELPKTSSDKIDRVMLANLTLKEVLH